MQWTSGVDDSSERYQIAKAAPKLANFNFVTPGPMSRGGSFGATGLTDRIMITGLPVQ
jgi:hypothetical protein